MMRNEMMNDGSGEVGQRITNRIKKKLPQPSEIYRFPLGSRAAKKNIMSKPIRKCDIEGCLSFGV